MLFIVTLAALVTLTSVLSVNASDKGIHLLILSGQSNMEGLDPSISFTPTVEAAFGKGDVIVVKDAKGSMPIRRWYKEWKPENGPRPKGNGDLYDRLMAKVNTAIKGKKMNTISFARQEAGDETSPLHRRSSPHPKRFVSFVRFVVQSLRSNVEW